MAFGYDKIYSFCPGLHLKFVQLVLKGTSPSSKEAFAFLWGVNFTCNMFFCGYRLQSSLSISILYLFDICHILVCIEKCFTSRMNGQEIYNTISLIRSGSISLIHEQGTKLIIHLFVIPSSYLRYY
jgi:hypothetical protein